MVGNVLHRPQGSDGAVLLVLVRLVADFAKPMEEDGTRQAVAGLTLVGPSGPTVR